MVAAARGDNAAATVAAIQAAGGRAEPASLDVTDARSVDALVAATLARHGRIDILVNNAGSRATADAADEARRLGRGAGHEPHRRVRLRQAVLKPMIRQRAGRIISISSVVGQTGNAGQANYAASKAGLIGFSKALAREVASRNIRSTW